MKKIIREKMKRIVALGLAIIMVFTTIIGCSDEKKAVTTDNAPLLTRAQWVQLVGMGFGLDSPQSEEPYYADVHKENSIFPYVQAAYEWNVLSTNTDKFKPNDVATLGFVISTSVLAAELDYKEFVSDYGENGALIKCANKYGIYEVDPEDTDKLTSGVTDIEASIILNAAIHEYLAKDEAGKNEVVYVENVKDFSKEDKFEVNKVGTTKAISANVASSLEVGDVFITPPTSEYPTGLALKVSKKTLNADGTYSIETVKPDISEVFEQINIDAEAIAKAENFIPEEGVKIIKDNNSSSNTGAAYVAYGQIDDLSGTDSRIDETIKGSLSGTETITFDINLRDKSTNLKKNSALEAALGVVSAKLNETGQKNPDFKAFKSLMEKTGTTVEPTQIATLRVKELIESYRNKNITKTELKNQIKKLEGEYTKKEKTEKRGSFDAGYSITGQVKVDLSVKANVDFSIWKWKLNEYSVSADAKLSGNIDFKGTIKGDVTIAKFKVPVGGGVSVDGKLKLFFDVNGEIKYSVEVDANAKISYESGKGYKNTCEKSVKHGLELSVSLEGGFKVAILASILGYSLVDVTVSASALIEMKTELKQKLKTEFDENTNTLHYTNIVTLSSKGDLYLPIIKIKVGDDKDTLVHDLGISLEFTVWDKDRALFKKSFIDESVDWVIADETEQLGEDETTTEEPTSSGLDETQDNSGALNLSEFAVSLQKGDSKIITVKVPEGYKSNDIKWESDDNSVATVSNGVIQAIGEGSATITVSTKDGKYTSKCIVLVN